MKKSFDQWMKELDDIILRGYGISIYDLIDCPYWDWWNSGVRVKTAVNRVIKINGGV